MEETKLLRKRNLAIANKNLESQANICRKLGELYLTEQRYEEALEIYKEEKNVCAALGQVIQVAVANRRIGEVYCNMGEYLEALKCMKQHLELAKAEGDLKEEQRALATIGRTYFFMAESYSSGNESSYKRTLREAKQAYILSLRVCDKLQNVGRVELMQMRSRLMLNMGLVLECQGKIQKGIENIQMAISINLKEDLYEDLYRCYSSLAALYFRQKNVVKALRYFDQAQEVAEQLSDKVILLCETLTSKAEIYFGQANFQGAKSVLTQAYKLQPPQGSERELLEKNLRIALVLCQNEETLLKTQSEDYYTLKNLYETMGDGCCAVKNFEKALTFYHKMLECAQALGDGGSELVPIYVSLAQTYKDNGDYNNALEYSYKELELWENNSAEACKTCINIGQLLELKGSLLEVLEQNYNNAYLLAVKAKSEKLETTVLRHLLELQERYGCTEHAEETKKRIEVIKQNLVESDSSEEEEDDDENDGGTQDIGSNINLEDILGGQGEQSEEFDRPRARQTRKHNQGLRIIRNEKGESQLHVACIHGSLQRVRKLLELGHPVNEQDNGGWLPLHEASNHGYVEIVEELLNHGAAINSTGGKGTGGITSLHDAASNGHLRVLELLLDRGALIGVHTDVNETPLDCLLDWYTREGDQMSPEDVSLFQTIQARMKNALGKAGVSTETSVERRSASLKLVGEKSRSPVRRSKDLRRSLEDEASSRKRWRRARTDSSEEEDGIMHRRKRVLSTLDDTDHSSIENIDPSSPQRHEDGEGALEYQRVIRGLREKPAPEPMTKIADRNVKSGLFLAEGDSGDDWLEDDLGDLSKSNKRRKVKDTNRSDASEYLGTSTRRVNPHSIEDEDKDVAPVNDETFEVEAVFTRSPDGAPIQERLPTRKPTFHSSLVNVIPASSCSPLMKVAASSVKVQVEDRLLFIPIPTPECTVDWLAREAAQRYHKLEGREPVLILLTMDGAALSPDDPVSVILDQDKLTSSVIAWKLVSLTKRYADSCQTLNTERDVHIFGCLETCEGSHKLLLNELNLTLSQLAPVFHALQPQRDLQELHLASNMLMDEGVERLASSLAKLQSLQVLDLSCNNITCLGLTFLSNIVTASTSALSALVVLNLGYNNFVGDAWLRNLHALVKGLHSLRRLHLPACTMTTAAFDIWSGPDTPLSGLSSLEELDISDNPLEEEGVGVFLQHLDPSRMSSLNVAATGNGSIISQVVRFLSRAEPSNLQSLDLSNCNAMDDELYNLLRCLQCATNLQSLCLRNNPQLTSVSLRRLSELPVPPPMLDLSGCNSLGMHMSAGCLSRWFSRDVLRKLQSLTITNNSVVRDISSEWELVQDSWKNLWGSKAIIQKGPIGFISLTVATHEAV